MLTEAQKFKAAKAKWKHPEWIVTFDQDGVKLRITANGYTSTHMVAAMKQDKLKLKHAFIYPYNYDPEVVKDFIKLAEKTFN